MTQRARVSLLNASSCISGCSRQRRSAARMPFVSRSVNREQGLEYIQQLQRELRDEALVSRTVYQQAAEKFAASVSQPTVQCVLIDSFRQTKHLVHVKLTTHRADDLWEAELQERHVRTLLGLDILKETYEGVSFRQTQTGKPRLGRPHNYFYRWTGKLLPMASWCISDRTDRTYMPCVGRSLMFTKQVINSVLCQTCAEA